MHERISIWENEGGALRPSGRREFASGAPQPPADRTTTAPGGSGLGHEPAGTPAAGTDPRAERPTIVIGAGHSRERDTP